MVRKIILSSNLFMNDTATKNTMKKLQDKEKDANILIINNAEPMYGITSVNGFKNYGYLFVNEITVSANSLDEQLPLIRSADIVVLSGGNPFPLLEALNETNTLSYLNNDVVIVGVSAGAMVLGYDIGFLEKIDPSSNKEGQFTCFSGFNYFNGKSIIPHCDEEEYFTKEQIEKAIGFLGENFILINKEDEIENL